ncbi:MAG: toll/interleukin-1 receptor domain-containing protein [Pseudonocardiaceae bacterium]
MTRAQTSDTDDDPKASSGGIFINYRRCDVHGGRRCHAMFVEALSHQLAHHFGGQQVFIDRSTRPGSEYPTVLKQKLLACEVLLVVIHAEWLEDLQSRRETGKDWVHCEIATVLDREPKAVVIPVMLDDAPLPDGEKLTEDIQGLLLSQTFRLRSGSLPDDLTRLVAELETYVRPSWPAPEVDDKKMTKPRPASVRAALGWALGAFILALALGFASTGSEPELVFAVSGFSLVLMAAPLLIMGIIMLCRRPIYEIRAGAVRRTIRTVPALRPDSWAGHHHGDAGDVGAVDAGCGQQVAVRRAGTSIRRGIVRRRCRGGAPGPG